MKKILLFILLGAITMTAQQKEIKKEDLKTDNDKASYAMGYNYGNILKDGGINIIGELFLKGFQDGLANNPKLLDDAEFGACIQKVLQQISANMSAKAEKDKADNKDYNDGAAFLEANKTKPGVVTTKSGLQYKVIKKGGKKNKPTATQTVKVNYEGRFIDGKIFDSSYERKEPISFPLNRVIPGWTEGLQLMSPGDKYELYIPYELGYGSQGRGTIPPFATLVFTVELLGIEK
jgi:FKBP-type peptidyl-prolyl cis-trans isomerase